MRQATIDKLEEMKKLTASGMTVDDALAKLKMGKATYYMYRDQVKPKKTKQRIIALPAQPERSDKVMVFFGEPSAVAAAAKELL